MLRRFFKSLEHCVEAALRQHVNFIYQVNFKAAAGRHVLNIVEQLAHIIDAGTRCSIYFDEVNISPLGNLVAGSALTTGCGGDALFTIQALRQDPGNGGFANTPGTGKEVCMV